MVKPPELWAFILANTLLFLISSVLAGLSYLAYRHSGGRQSYRNAAVGFGFVVFGGLVEPAYQLGVEDVKNGYALSGNELLLLQAGEGILIATGLGLLFYAITRHDDRSPEKDDDPFWTEADDEVHDVGY